MNIGDLIFNDQGLIPCIVQDAATKDVLMMAWMNAETVQRTLDERTTWFFSRSRNKLWHKGEESGNVQHVVSVTADCDFDALVVRVIKEGPACHTGAESCFHNPLAASDAQSDFTMKGLYELIEGRKTNPQEGSYTTYLFEKGIDKILKKIGEESTEVIIGAKNSKEEAVYEIADLAYHVMVMMAEMDIPLTDVTKELAKRHVIDHKVKQETMQ